MTVCLVIFKLCALLTLVQIFQVVIKPTLAKFSHFVCIYTENDTIPDTTIIQNFGNLLENFEHLNETDCERKIREVFEGAFNENTKNFQLLISVAKSFKQCSLARFIALKSLFKELKAQKHYTEERVERLAKSFEMFQCPECEVKYRSIAFFLEQTIEFISDSRIKNVGVLFLDKIYNIDNGETLLKCIKIAVRNLISRLEPDIIYKKIEQFPKTFHQIIGIVAMVKVLMSTEGYADKGFEVRNKLTEKIFDLIQKYPDDQYFHAKLDKYYRKALKYRE